MQEAVAVAVMAHLVRQEAPAEAALVGEMGLAMAALEVLDLAAAVVEAVMAQMVGMEL